jgi:hypothetical protein
MYIHKLINYTLINLKNSVYIIDNAIYVLNMMHEECTMER